MDHNAKIQVLIENKNMKSDDEIMKETMEAAKAAAKKIIFDKQEIQIKIILNKIYCRMQLSGCNVDDDKGLLKLFRCIIDKIAEYDPYQRKHILSRNPYEYFENLVEEHIVQHKEPS